MVDVGLDELLGMILSEFFKGWSQLPEELEANGCSLIKHQHRRTGNTNGSRRQPLVAPLNQSKASIS